MSVRLRPYQADLHHGVNAAWAAGCIDVGVNSPTGSGKTVFFAHEMQVHQGASIAIAHRQELTAQISLALARNEVRHRIVGQPAVTKNIISIHLAELGRDYTNPNARCAVAGIDTLIRLKPNDRAWCDQTTLLVQDEAHHGLVDNKWGVGRKMFRNAKGLHVSATWLRADGKGLGRHADGFVDLLINAPTMREMINKGYLTDYRVIGVKTTDLDLSKVEVSDATGDLNQHQLREAVHKSNRLVGDVVKHYLQWAPGKLGVTFAVDVEAAIEIAAAFRAAGVPAEVVSAKTPDHLRMEILRRFKRREVLQLVNVDLFGEGFDLPAIEVVSFARPTESWALYCQQFGRVLRLMLDPSLYPIWDALTDAQRLAYIAASEKPFGMIIDHVGNIIRHMGPPDKRMEFTLDRRERRSGKKFSDAIPHRACLNPNVDGTGLPCTAVYERVYKCCPECGFYPEPAARSGPEFVDGDLHELDAETLAKMRGDIGRIDGAPVLPYGADYIVRMAVNKRHVERQEAQIALRSAMSWWSGLQDALGRPDLEEKYRRFYLAFGVDTATAQTYGSADAEKLRNKIAEQLLRYGIDGTVNPALP